MDLEVRPHIASSRWAIGEPGRAALELRPSRPARPGAPPDLAVSSASLDSMLAQAATTRGLLHVARGKPRQDAYALGFREADGGGESLVAVVCDGVGSLGRSHEAAELVSRTLVTEAERGSEWPEAFDRANDELHAFAEQETSRNGADPRADGMATTAVAISVGNDTGEWIADVGWVGDSSCWHLEADGSWRQVGGPVDEGEDDDGYYTGRVVPLPYKETAYEVRSLQLSGGALFLMSDGVANPLKWSEEVQVTLAEWWSEPPDLLTFAAQVGFARKTHMDDRTVVGIWLEDDREEEDPDGAQS
ncbi:MAG: protein phosphatase 2C domain-containing protein [Actinomycetota bacterium]|nr:protein phosphatase 2C domain-containing protein [Actinomycetota bacterium]